jgi:hypothetical protein
VASANGTKPTASSTAGTGSSNRDPAKDQEAFLKFAQCMRDHGIPMPDPQFDGGGVGFSIPEGTDKSKVDAAQAECKQNLPNGGEPEKLSAEDQEKMRKFAQCMRENGVPKFPDPSEDGGMMINGDEIGVDPQSEAFKNAEKACEQYSLAPPGGKNGGPETQQHAENNSGGQA